MMQCNFIELNTITFEAFYVAKHGSICNQTCVMVCVYVYIVFVLLKAWWLPQSDFRSFLY